MTQHLAAESERLSALIDGELTAPETGKMLAACQAHPWLSDDWTVYHCIGDVLRSDDMGCHSAALANKLAARLALEPHLLGASLPAADADSVRWRRPASLAAAAAAVAAVAWLALPQLRPAQEQIAAVPAGIPAAVLAAPLPQPAPRVANGYVEAHRQYSSSVAAYRGGGLVQNVTFDSGR